MITAEVITTCDRCERQVEEPRELRFSVQSRVYEIDLCEGCSETWNACLGPFIEAARRGHPKRKDHVVRLDR